MSSPQELDLPRSISPPRSGFFIWLSLTIMSESIEAANKAKSALEDLILEKIRAFESEYGIGVQSVDLIHRNCIGSSNTVASVSLVVEI